jgi:hypothetical protein
MTIRKVAKVFRFFLHSPNKGMYFKTLFLSGFYRMVLLFVPMKILMKYIGALNEESKPEETEEACRQTAVITDVVNRVCRRTPWESKCLVRALTIRYFLKKKKISSTLYLGVGKDRDRMIAHAWLRSGSYYIAGGHGEGYAPVAKFRN